MEQTKEFSVTLDDRPGTLAKATDAIAKAGINIDGYCAVPSGNQGKGTFRVGTKDPAGTRKAREAAGCKGQDERDAAAKDAPMSAQSCATTGRGRASVRHPTSAAPRPSIARARRVPRRIVAT